MTNLYNQNLTTLFFFAPSPLSSFLLYRFLPTLGLCTLFMLCMFSCSVVPNSFATPWTIACQAPLTMEFSRQEHWCGLPFLSAGIFPTQGSNPSLPHHRQILYQLNHQGSPRILEWVAYPFSSDLPDPGIESGPSAWKVRFFTS